MIGVLAAWLVCLMGQFGHAATDAAAEPPTTAAEPAPVPTGLPAPATDDETPVAPKRRAPGRSTDNESPRTPAVTTSLLPPPYKPRFDFGAEFGLVQGGEELATATNSNGDKETLGAGDGMLLAFTTRLTPLWLGDRLGLGVGGSAGLKYWSVGGTGAEASMFRWVLTGSAHALIAANDTWLIFFSGGVEKDTGIDFAINGTSYGIPFESRTGFVGDFGAQHALDDYWSWAFSLRVTVLDYDVQGASIGANSVGVTISIHCGS